MWWGMNVAGYECDKVQMWCGKNVRGTNVAGYECGRV